MNLINTCISTEKITMSDVETTNDEYKESKLVYTTVMQLVIAIFVFIRETSDCLVYML